MADLTGLVRAEAIAALQIIRPGAAWSMSGATLTWQDTEQAAPTREEIEAGIAAVASARAITNVRAEAQRRIIVLTGSADLTGCLIKQLNANMRANELNDIRHTRALTPAEEAEAVALRGLALAIQGIRASSNVLEAMTPVPSDFAANHRWP